MIEMQLFHLQVLKPLGNSNIFMLISVIFCIYLNPHSAWTQYKKRYDKMADVLNLKLLNP